VNVERLAGEDGRGVGETLHRRNQLYLRHHLLFLDLEDYG